jgi:hypothetical protein
MVSRKHNADFMLRLMLFCSFRLIDEPSTFPCFPALHRYTTFGMASGTPDHAALVFQCFEGIELLHVHTAATSLILVLRLQPVHRLILQLLGPPYEKISYPSG